jgi:hypothetical protein
MQIPINFINSILYIIILIIKKMNYSINESAQAKMLLHVIKYHKFDCIGVLVGKKDGSSVQIVDAVPLFHQRLMTPTLEVAFEILDATL